MSNTLKSLLGACAALPLLAGAALAQTAAAPAAAPASPPAVVGASGNTAHAGTRHRHAMVKRHHAAKTAVASPAQAGSK